MSATEQDLKDMVGKLKGVEDKLLAMEKDLKDKDQKLNDTIGELKGVGDKLVVTEQDLKEKNERLKETEKKLVDSENKITSMDDVLKAAGKELLKVKAEYDQFKMKGRGIFSCSLYPYSSNKTARKN